MSVLKKRLPTPPPSKVGYGMYLCILYGIYQCARHNGRFMQIWASEVEGETFLLLMISQGIDDFAIEIALSRLVNPELQQVVCQKPAQQLWSKQFCQGISVEASNHLLTSSPKSYVSNPVPDQSNHPGCRADPQGWHPNATSRWILRGARSCGWDMHMRK